MFKKAKRKIVITILAILTTVLTGTLTLVFVSSYYSTIGQNYEVLETHLVMLADESNPNRNQTKGPKDPGHKEGRPVPFGPNMTGEKKIQRHLKLNTFYTVKIAADGRAEVLENGADALFSNEELIEYARKFASKTRGRTSEFLYIVGEKDGDILVCFMDNIVLTDSFMRVLLYTLLFGAIALAIITFISIRIAGRIVAPMEESYLKQKQFTADASHELKTPIAAMAANIDILKREIGENKWLDNISYENERMRELVTELLELARNENRTVQKTSTDISYLVNGTVVSMESAAFEKNILIESEIEDEITANVDEKGISQLVTILVDNAISHTTSVKGDLNRIFVKLYETKGKIVFSVSNPGEEIPINERNKLFERFYRADSSHEFSGHYGLGLAIAKSIADANDAKITVECKDGFVVFKVFFA
ncbi:MAG: HAMP domain-containing histidine kinase [Lachnospiraceae bacterium]|nr:HAMP domain-containing histidine kinase [Candidatus Colinaster equi]